VTKWSRKTSRFGVAVVGGCMLSIEVKKEEKKVLNAVVALVVDQIFVFSLQKKNLKISYGG